MGIGRNLQVSQRQNSSTQSPTEAGQEHRGSNPLPISLPHESTLQHPGCLMRPLLLTAATNPHLSAIGPPLCTHLLLTKFTLPLGRERGLREPRNVIALSLQTSHVETEMRQDQKMERSRTPTQPSLLCHSLGPNSAANLN